MRGLLALLSMAGLLAFALAPDPARAQGAPDGGSACLAQLCACLQCQPDAGVPPSVWLQEQPGVVSVSVPPDVTTGSEIGAGLDPNAGEQVLHPDNLTDLKVSFRQVGTVFRAANASLAVQANPYMLAHGNDLVYEQLAAERRTLYGRLAQDTALTFALAPETPYVGEVFATGRFATFGLGFSTDLLGLRSVYSREYSECLHAPDFQASVGEFIRTHTRPPGWDPLPGETDADRDKRHAGDPRLAAYDRAMVEELNRVRQHVRECSQKYTGGDRAVALFLSAGERVITPGPVKVVGDKVSPQRSYAALTGGFYALKSWEFAAQVRGIAERLHSADPMERWIDGAVSVAYAGAGFRCSLEGSQAFVFSGAPVGTLSGAVRFRVYEKFSLQLQFAGSADRFWKAFSHASIGIALAYEEGKVVELGVPRDLLPLPAGGGLVR